MIFYSAVIYGVKAVNWVIPAAQFRSVALSRAGLMNRFKASRIEVQTTAAALRAAVEAPSA